MAVTSELIDGIAREVGHDVLYLEFTEDAHPELIDAQADEITSWLDEIGVEWKIVEGFDPDEADFVCIEGGPSCIYLNIDPDSDFSSALMEKFVTTDGSAKIQGLHLKRLSYSAALAHSKRDDPDYWDKLV